MKLKNIITILLIAGSFKLNAGVSVKENLAVQSHVFFEENKGQIRDQNGKKRDDILFIGKSGDITFYISSKGISYQLSKLEEKLTEGANKMQVIKTNRIDIQWKNHNSNFKIEYGKELPSYTNYCNTGGQPVLGVKSYSDVWIKNIYPNIDLHYFINDNQLEYDFITQPNADYTKINWDIQGAEISLNKKGELLMETPIGSIIEGTPKVYQENKLIQSNWVLNGNQINFNLGKYDKSKSLQIDPLVMSYGTYYGANSTVGKSCKVDDAGNIILAGNTSTGTEIATTGSFQTTITGSPSSFIAKFNSNGVRQWATYFGGDVYDNLLDMNIDLSGNILIVGYS